MASTEFEPATLGSSGKHTNHYTTMATHNSHWSEHVKAISQYNKPVSSSISPVTVHGFFSSSSYMFRMQEWFNLARYDVLGLRRTPPLVSFLVGSFIFNDTFLDVIISSGIRTNIFPV
jgi:hypothetical protein